MQTGTEQAARVALLLLGVFLVYPAVSTILRSFQDAKGAFTFANWASLGTGPFLEILRNNAIWLIFATGGSATSSGWTICTGARPGP